MNSINYLAVGLVAVLNYAISFVWYMYLFRAPYVAGLNKTKEEMDKGPSMLSASIMQILGNIVMALALAWLMQQLQYHTAVQGMKLGAIAWLGFVAAVMGPMYAFQAYSLSFFLINSLSVLLSLLLAGGVIGAWN